MNLNFLMFRNNLLKEMVDLTLLIYFLFFFLIIGIVINIRGKHTNTIKLYYININPYNYKK
jgi:hypothetical protein